MKVQMVKEIDRVTKYLEEHFLPAFEKIADMQVPFEFQKHWDVQSAMQFGLKMPFVLVNATAASPRLNEEGALQTFGPDLMVSVVIGCHRENMGDALRLRDQAIEILLDQATDAGYPNAGIYGVGSKGDQDPRSWAAFGGICLGRIEQDQE